MPAALAPTPLPRDICPQLPGSVHFNVTRSPAMRRGLVEGEETCGGFVNIAGLLPNSLDASCTAHDTELAAAARVSLQRICHARFSEDPDGCSDALRLAAMCGNFPFCASAAGFSAVSSERTTRRPGWGTCCTAN